VIGGRDRRPGGGRDIAPRGDEGRERA
jgi:hypothetical protein